MIKAGMAGLKLGGLVLVLFGVLVSPAFAETGEDKMDHSMHGGMSGMVMDATGMVMNANSETLPDDCQEISRDHEFTVIAGTEYASPFADTIFGFNQHEWKVEPCSRVTITFKNEDQVRHQWMVHGLPKYIYDQGMFHMEAAGGHTQVGTFIVPSDDRTYLAHCDIAQHMEKGMKGQLVVGKGSGDLWSIPGLTAKFERPVKESFPRWLAPAIFLAGFLLIVGVLPGINACFRGNCGKRNRDK